MVSDKIPNSPQINVAVPAHLAKLAREKGFLLIYISTDYVFNGRK
jgi:S-adenosylmethionine synthetase